MVMWFSNGLCTPQYNTTFIFKYVHPLANAPLQTYIILLNCSVYVGILNDRHRRKCNLLNFVWCMLATYIIKQQNVKTS